MLKRQQLVKLWRKNIHNNTSILHGVQSRCSRHLLRYSPAHLPHSSVFPLIPGDSRPGEAARVDSLRDCTLTDSTTLITASSSYFINFPQAEKIASQCVPPGGRSNPLLDVLIWFSSVFGAWGATPTHTHARADACVHVATVYCGNRWFSFITSRLFFSLFKPLHQLFNPLSDLQFPRCCKQAPTP